MAFVSKPKTGEELEADIAEAEARGLPWRVLGGGSNVLLPDAGFAGVIMIPAVKHLEWVGEAHFSETPLATSDTRYQAAGEGYLRLEEQAVAGGEPAWVRMGAGVPWGQAVSWSLNQELTGLHWYARIPCAVGGAVYNNIHGEKHFLAEVIQEVVSYRPGSGWVRRLPSELRLGYDSSVFHAEKQEVIWEVCFKLERVSKEAAEAARSQYIAWTKAKVTAQPSGANCGSTFQNVPADQAQEGRVSAGWYIEHAGCMGWEEGALQVSSIHANFFTNRGGGTQSQVIRLMERVREAVHARFGIWLVPEVECMEPDGSIRNW